MRRILKGAKALLLRMVAGLMPIVPNRVRLLSMGPSGSNTLALLERAPSDLTADLDIKLVSPFRPKGLVASLKYAVDLGRAAVVVSTHGYRKMNRRQSHVELWHGFPLKGMNRMDPSELEAKTVNSALGQVDLVASYSALYSSLMNACMGLDASRYRITGMPRNDLLEGADGEALLDEVLGAPTKGRKVVFFMPTFRKALGGRVDGDKSALNIFGFERFDAERFESYLRREGIRLVAKLHPFEERVFFAEGASGPPPGIELLTDKALKGKGIELYRILARADALITDYSSVYFDLLLKDLPLVFTPVDLEAYKSSRGFLLEPYPFWAPGPKATDQEALEGELTRALRDTSYFAEERARVRDIVHAYQDFHSSERVWAAVRGLLGGSKPTNT